MSDANTQPRRGGCLCGAVRYAVTGRLRPVLACHCTTCRKTSGNFVAATAARRAEVVIEGEEAITWHRTSSWARRGFCRHCGAQLFYDRDDSDVLSIMAGSLDQPSGLKIVRHLCIEEKGDFYELDDDLPKQEGWHHDVW